MSREVDYNRKGESSVNHMPNTQVEVAKAAGYAMIKYASFRYPEIDFKICSRLCKGGVLRVWVEHEEIPVTDPLEVGRG